MTVEMGVVFAIVGVALYLFASQRLPLDVTALAIMVIVMVVPFVGRLPWLREQGVDLPSAFPTVPEGLSGLSSEATVTVLAMFILSAGIQRSGLLHVLGRRIIPFVGDSEVRLLLTLTVVVGLTSGMVNNTAAVAVAIPFVLELTRNLGMSASKFLMPLSFIGMLGGMITLIGTSTNILAATVLADLPEFGRQLGMFEFAPVGLLVLVTGLAYFLVAGRFLLPDTDLGRTTDDSDEADDEEFVVELRVPAGSRWVGESLAESGRAASVGVEVLRLTRGDEQHRGSAAEEVAIEAGDVVTVRGVVRQVADLISSEDVDVATDMDGRNGNGRAGDGFLVRALVRNRWLFNGEPAGSIGFWRRYRVRLIGLETERLRARRLADERLRVGEIVLVEAAEEDLPRLRRHPDLVLLSEFEDEFDTRRMWMAGGILVAAVLGAALTPLPIVVTALVGVALMALTGCVTKDDLYSGVPWEVIFMLAGVIPLGIAMTKSGSAEWLGDQLAAGAAGRHPLVMLMVLYVLTALLTEVVSNNASVVILIPVAVSLSTSLDLPVIALALTVMFAASTSFLSPVGYQTNAMVFGTGLYRFTDFAKVGGPLTVILTGVTCPAIWVLWVR